MATMLDIIPDFDEDDCVFIIEQRRAGWEWKDIAYWNDADPMQSGMSSQCEWALRKRAAAFEINYLPPAEARRRAKRQMTA